MYETNPTKTGDLTPLAQRPHILEALGTPVAEIVQGAAEYTGTMTTVPRKDSDDDR